MINPERLGGVSVTAKVWRDSITGLRTGLPGPAIEMPLRRSRLRLRLQILLFGVDTIGLSAASCLAALMWIGGRAGTNGAQVGVALVAAYWLIGANAGLFSADILTRRRQSVLAAIRSVLLASAGIILIAFFLKTGAQISRVELAISGALGALLVGCGRIVFHTWTLHSFGSRLHAEIIILDDCEAEVSAGIYRVDASAYNLRCDLADPLMLDRIGRLVAAVDRVVIACPLERRRDWAMVMKGTNIRAEILSPELAHMGPLGIGQFSGRPTVVVSTGSLDLRQRAMKRGLDLFLAGSALLLLFPLLIAVAVAIKIDSAGPALFVQDRVGRGNRIFGIYKFRSMGTDVGDKSGKRSASRDDNRITRIGRLIRATSIDELPQLINIFKGEMSFVGPRPHALGSLAGDQLFWEVDERYWHRHVCKPGMTGLAQIRGFRGATHLASDLANRLQADLEYVTGWTVLRDISILFATLRVIVHRNAY